MYNCKKPINATGLQEKIVSACMCSCLVVLIARAEPLASMLRSNNFDFCWSNLRAPRRIRNNMRSGDPSIPLNEWKANLLVFRKWCAGPLLHSIKTHLPQRFFTMSILQIKGTDFPGVFLLAFTKPSPSGHLGCTHTCRYAVLRSLRKTWQGLELLLALVAT